MTAIVAVLNKHGVAVAADSAVTMGDTHKVVNSANKIFTLSKYHPVAVMTYSNASFMGVPWDIIIKEYRKQLGDKPFDSLEGYVADFIQYLHKKHFFCDEKTQRKCLLYEVDSLCNLCMEETARASSVPAAKLPPGKLEAELKAVNDRLAKMDVCPELVSLKPDDIKDLTAEGRKKLANKYNISDVDLLGNLCFNLFRSRLNTSYTGLVFVGYGESEIYPSLLPINISFGVKDYLRYYVDEKSKAAISEHGTSAAVRPFAQTDVMLTIMQGIQPSFQNIIGRVVGGSIRSFAKDITDILDADPNTRHLSEAVKKLDVDSAVHDATAMMNDAMFKSYTEPLLDTIILLDKEDMANMAESFISLTSLIRRMQPGEETVGGPVDVAVITKGDGFVWIKRKHYFRPELNAPFFSNYFKH